MEINAFNTRLKIEFPFILVLCVCGLTSSKNLLDLVLYSSAHEFGHLLALIFCGGSVECLSLSYFGIGLKYKESLSRLKELFVIAAGPIVNLVLYLILMDNINLMLFLINLLPIFPLDGGRLVRLISYKVSKVLSVVFLTCLVLLSLYLIVCYKSFSLIFIALYLIIYSLNY